MRLYKENKDISSRSSSRHEERGASAILPRLSAAMTTPSLNFTARTDVPVTMGCCVWV